MIIFVFHADIGEVFDAVSAPNLFPLS